MPADNEQFATSGGATRLSGSAKQQLLALVRAFAIPPPAASCHHVGCNALAAHRTLTAKLDSAAEEAVESKSKMNKKITICCNRFQQFRDKTNV